MKPPIAITAALLLAATLNLHAQGSLTPPPGAPGAVMKTLDQVEARTPVNTLPGDAAATHIITLPGSYYLTGPITGNTGKVGIRIEAVNVTLDLNGFAIEGVSGSTKGITANATGGPVVIRNGILRFWANGIDISGGVDFILQDIQVAISSATAVLIDGHGTVDRVCVRTAVGNGISATASSRVKISDCRIDGLTGGQAFGISAPIGDIQNCYVANITGGGGATRGIFAQNGSVHGCTLRSITGGWTTIGILAERVSNSVITGIQSSGDASTGVEATLSVTNTEVSGITSGSLVAYGIHKAKRVANCDVSSVSGGSTINSGVEQCQEVTDTKVRDCSSGIRDQANGLIARNHVSNANNGISASNGSVILDNRVVSESNVGTGIYSFGTTLVRIEGNHVTGFQTGISATSTAVVIRNSAGGNTANYAVGAGVTIVTPAAMGTNPFANISQ